MIIEKHKLIFVHIIKTAGVSIETQYGVDTHDHRTALQYKTELGEASYKDHFSFTVTRNPWDKMVSQYFYNAFNWVPKGSSFKDYIKVFGEGKQITRFSPYHLPYITDEKNKIIVDYIGRFEELEKTMRVVSKESGIPYQPLPHKNKTKRNRDYTHYYDDETREIIARLFKEEIELFDYEFGREKGCKSYLKR